MKTPDQIAVRWLPCSHSNIGPASGRLAGWRRGGRVAGLLCALRDDAQPAVGVVHRCSGLAEEGLKTQSVMTQSFYPPKAAPDGQSAATQVRSSANEGRGF